ncbi:CRISPR-associated endonuclease Cas2 [Enterococcus cecorum]|uniref:CRISPR-associated endonuclease Cas2 n=1 Tax=Enterococcus cecorum TaxID=44008 RepID=UPI0032C4782E
MSYRYMRILVFFDLPVLSLEQRRDYRSFRKFLIKDGFIMLQESVYCKMVLNESAAKAVVGQVKKNRPEDGLVQLLTVTEKQFSKMEYIVGEYKSEVLDSDQRLVIL